MRKGSIRNPNTRTLQFLRVASDAAVIVIDRRAESVAEVWPLSPVRGKIKFPDMRRFWNEFPQVAGDSTDFISEARDDGAAALGLRRSK